jgi:DNA-binding MarR family transcriptional regulator
VPSDSVDRMVEAWAERDPGLDTSPLQVVARLRLCTAHLERAIVVALRPLGLGLGDFDVLNTVRRRGDEAGTKPTDLARSALITSGGMTSRLDRLERAGLIERRADPEDRRGVLVRLTERGERVAAESLHAVLAADAAFVEPLNRPQRDSVAAALKRLLLRSEAAEAQPEGPRRSFG